jgi:deoxyadenosine/deoxycytidine kinase
MEPCLVAVAGIMGSGKTTLAKNIARALGWSYLPESLHAAYLADLFKDQARWAFSAQVAFLSDKAIQIQRNIEGQFDTILDRSLYEDVDIFAEYFRSQGAIDARSYRTYRSIANHFLSELKPPDLLIYCKCSVTAAMTRISARVKELEVNYPAGHLDEIARRYDEWIAAYDRGPVWVVDSERIDFRKDKEFRAVLDDVVRLVSLNG